MQIYLARNNQQAGPYTLEQLNAMLASNEVLLTDLMWHDGMDKWQSVGQMTGNQLAHDNASQPNQSNQPKCQFKCQFK